MCRRPLIPPSPDSDIIPELAIALPHPAEDTALRQFQHQMRALRAMLDMNNQPQVTGEAGQGNTESAPNLQNLMGAGIFEVGASWTSEGREDYDNQYSGMYS